MSKRWQIWVLSGIVGITAISVSGLMGVGLLVAAGQSEPSSKRVIDAPAAQSLPGRNPTRTFRLYRPPGAGPHPIVLLLHPAASDGATVWTQTSLPQLAEKHRFLLVAPDGMHRTWNSYPWKGGVDDVGFLKQLLDHLIEHEGGNPERICVTGMSAGAGMTFTIAWEIGDRLAAIAPVANNLGVDQAAQPMRHSEPIPMLHIMGTADPSVPYGGGKVFGIWPVFSTDETARFWRRHNGLTAKPEASPIPDRDRNDGSTAVEVRFPGESEVIQIRITGGGHTWPNGPASAVGERLLGKTNRDFDAGERIWAFFERHHRVRSHQEAE